LSNLRRERKEEKQTFYRQRKKIDQHPEAIFREVMTINIPGRPRTMARRMRGIVVSGPPGMADEMIKYSMKEIVAGKMRVPANSILTTNCIKKQNVPQRSWTSNNSVKL
jgi:hypothetical protein